MPCGDLDGWDGGWGGRVLQRGDIRMRRAGS